MAGKRLRWLSVTAAALVLYLASGSWLSCILLLGVLVLPWLSLAVSIPAIRKFTLGVAGADILCQGEAAQLWLLGSCELPMPPFRGSIHLTQPYTGGSWRYRPEQGLPTLHCGSLVSAVEKGRVCDYMGLFSFRVRNQAPHRILIRPHPLEIPDAPLPEYQTSLRMRPKPGGGFSENHEIRLYRPGDSLNQVHWKLSAKTGKRMLREPMEPVRGRVLLTMTLSGTPEELDRKLGRLLWMGSRLLERGTAFSLRVLTADGLLQPSVDSEAELMKALDTLLCARPERSGSIEQYAFAAEWQYHIGGQADET